jgi:uncharacterized phiE125 gp8 family phage protein
MSLVLIDPPAEEPATLAALKTHLKLDGAAEDALLLGLLLAARRIVEARHGLALIRQSWRLSLAAPKGTILLPLSPVLSIDSVGAARGGRVEALPAAALEAETGLIGRLTLKTPVDTLVVAFTAGWPDAASLPEELKLAVMILAAHFYEHREGEGRAPDLSALVAPYRRIRL